MQARPHPQTDNVKVSPTKKAAGPNGISGFVFTPNQRLASALDGTGRTATRRKSQENQTIFGAGLVHVNLTTSLTTPMPKIV